MLTGALAGNGVLPTSIFLDSGTALVPGDPAPNGGIGTLTTGPVAWTPGATLQFQLGATLATTDALIVNGALTRNSAGVPLRFHFGMGATPPVAGQPYTLVTTQNAGTLVVSDFFYDYDATYSSLTGHFDIVGSNVTFTVDALTASGIFANGFD